MNERKNVFISDCYDDSKWCDLIGSDPLLSFELYSFVAEHVYRIAYEEVLWGGKSIRSCVRRRRESRAANSEGRKKKKKDVNREIGENIGIYLNI